MKKKAFFLLLVIIVGWQYYGSLNVVRLGPGVMAPDDPQQIKMQYSVNVVNGFSIRKIASYHITAKVLSKKKYWFGKEVDISPSDVALGWGNMSDENILEKINISQSGRFYRWSVKSFPIPKREIETHSANVHLIPSDSLAKDTINDIRKGDIVEIFGSLVNATLNDWSWNSSTTRLDTGAGACELLWVDEIHIITESN